MPATTRSKNNKRKAPASGAGQEITQEDVGTSPVKPAKSTNRSKKKKGATSTASQSTEPDTKASTGKLVSNVVHSEVTSNDKKITCESRASRSSNDTTPRLIFTHGAGGGLESPAMQLFAQGFSTVSSIVSFKGSMNLAARTKSFRAVMQNTAAPEIALGGRSMGARAAALAATTQEPGSGWEEKKVTALVLVSYPLLAGGKGDNTKNDEGRTQLLLDVPEDIDVLFISGSEDSMGPLARLNEVRHRMSAKSWMVVVEGADHGMGRKGKAKNGEEDMRRQTGIIAAEWLRERDQAKSYCAIQWDTDREQVYREDWRKNQQGGDAKDEDAVGAPEAEEEQQTDEKDQGDKKTSKPPPAKRRKKAR